MTALTIGLLAIAIGAVLTRPARIPTWLIPAGCAVAVIAIDTTTISDARHAIEPLLATIAFLLAAVPLAVGFDRLGFFDAVAERLIATGRGTGTLWILAAAVTTLLNLDASIVLLTPLYINIARRTRRDPLTLAFQPVLLACLASSALPVSNLTNLIARSATDATTIDFVTHLAIPSLVATTVGWFIYNRVLHPDQTTTTPDLPVSADRARHPRALLAGGIILTGVVIGFVAGPTIGIDAWIVALVADLALAIVLRRPVHISDIPASTAIIVASLGVLAATVATHLPIDTLISGTSTLDLARTIAVTAIGANAINNLPALLIALPTIDGPNDPNLWATLIGVNIGPVILATGSLASLLWLDALHRLNVEATPRDFTRIGIKVGLPALLAGTLSFLLLEQLT